MFTKSLILVLLGSTLILAHPSEGEAESATEASKTGSKVWGFFQNLANKISNAWNSKVQSVKDVLNDLKGKYSEGKDIAKDGYDYLVEKGKEIAKKAADSVAAEKQRWAKKIEELKNSTTEAAQTVAWKIQDAERQAEEAIKKVVHDADKTWQDWKKEAKAAYEKAHQKQ